MQKYLVGYLVLLLTIQSVTEVSACKYNIRDVGFVDFGADVYRLYPYVAQDTSPEIRNRINDLAAAVFADSNIYFEGISDSDKTNPQALELLGQLQLETFPTAVLTVADRQPLVIPIPEDHEQMTMTFENLLSSPLRETLLKKLQDVYALVLVLHGADSERNTRALETARSSIAEISRFMDNMPKASGNPPELLELPWSQRAREKVLLWSLGVDEEDPQPAAVVLYGRGRIMGVVLKGQEISETHLDQYLSIVGLDCECGLDRRWMTGRRLPMKWDQQTQQQVAKVLNFDPESPMVKMEISRILMKGPNPDAAMDLKNLSPAGFGYQEIEISLKPSQLQADTDADAMPDEPVVTPQSIEQPALSRSTMIALAILGAIILGVGFSIAMRKNKNA